MLYAGVHKELMAGKIAKGTLHFAEQYSAMILATERCPPGSANDEHSTKSVDDPHAMCRRQELRMDQNTESESEQQSRRQKLGCKSRRHARRSSSRAAIDKQDFQKSVYLMGEFA